MMAETIFVGVDGCKSGWFTFIKQAEQVSFSIFETLADLEKQLTSPAIVLIDMPIGFPEKGQAFRLCDKLARQYLPGRSASVFPVPCKDALYATDYQTACSINEQIIGKRFPIQTWNIVPKIRQLDALLSRQQYQKGIKFYESHPELVFSGLAGKPMQFSKSSKQGQAERLQILSKSSTAILMVLEQALCQIPKKEAKSDDIIDAFVLMLAATKQENWQFLPATVDLDSFGNNRQIVFAPQRVK